jgi:radical SAM-linked protein
MHKLRLKFRKGESVRWLSHLELSRAWARALARAGAPLKYTEGFSPRPKLAFSPALPVGVVGEAEYLDVILTEPVAPESLTQSLSRVLPAGLTVLAISIIPPESRSLGAAIVAADYRVSVAPADIPGLLSAAGQEFAGFIEPTESGILLRRLPLELKPSAVVAGAESALGRPLERVIIDRTMLWVLVNGKLEALA